jgi:SAM-dependent MidA family methyltransferase
VNPLAESLRADIADRGPITFREFMARALYDREHGYYGSGKARVGREGDFFTNVSVGPLFGSFLARQFHEMWQRLGQPGDFALVEQGAHQGDLARDVLAALREFAPDCFAAATLWLVEPVGAWRQMQEKRLTDFSPAKVRWADSLEALPPFRGVHFSNELLDAFPVHRVCRRSQGWVERLVDFQEDRFVFVDGPISSGALRTHLTHFPGVPTDYETEVCLEVEPWLATVATQLEAGFVLTIDYGYPREEYYRPERNMGTLSAYSAHRREPDPLQRPGEIDLTAHVDFTTLAETAEQHGLEIAGFADQHHFIVGLSRLHFRDDHALSAAGQRELRAFKTLMHPTLMGSSFQALCLAKRVSDVSLTGFGFANDTRANLGLEGSAPSLP